MAWGGVDLSDFVSVFWWDGGMVAVLCGMSAVGLRKVCVLLTVLPHVWLGNVQVFSKLAFRYCGWPDTKMQTFRSRQTWFIVQQGISALSCRPCSGMLCLPCIVLLCPALPFLALPCLFSLLLIARTWDRSWRGLFRRSSLLGQSAFGRQPLHAWTSLGAILVLAWSIFEWSLILAQTVFVHMPYSMPQ